LLSRVKRKEISENKKRIKKKKTPLAKSSRERERTYYHSPANIAGKKKGGRYEALQTAGKKKKEVDFLESKKKENRERVHAGLCVKSIQGESLRTLSYSVGVGGSPFFMGEGLGDFAGP